MKKVLMIIGGIVVGSILLFILMYLFVSFTSNKLVCKSKEGNITILYNDKTITGYKAINMSYDKDTQTKYAEQIGTDTYIKEFKTWFETNTTGTCK